MTFAWNETTFERAKALYLSGVPAAAIAAEIGAASRSAVIGKMNRAGITSPTPRYNAECLVRPIREAGAAKQAKLPPPKPVMLAPSPATGKTLMDLAPRECRYPTGENAEGKHVFCAAETRPGESYCPDCRALVYAPPGTKQRVGYTPMRGIA